MPSAESQVSCRTGNTLPVSAALPKSTLPGPCSLLLGPCASPTVHPCGQQGGEGLISQPRLFVGPAVTLPTAPLSSKPHRNSSSCSPPPLPPTSHQLSSETSTRAPSISSPTWPGGYCKDPDMLPAPACLKTMAQSKVHTPH